MNTYLSIREVKDLLKVSERTVRRWISAGELPALKIGRSVRIREEDILLHSSKPAQTNTRQKTQLAILAKARTLRVEIQKQPNTPATDILNEIRLDRAHAQ